ncbi:MAG: MotA/TolQ/ExbB proton channel family protein [Bacteroides sp.]|jgi:biopolymer transport protein ExbB|nr:MotA/TolQ/ExbB proton channel family protein [Bacteroides sp.]
MLSHILLQVQMGSTAQVVDTLAQTPTQTFETMTLWSLMVKGGIIMIPLAILSIWAIYIFIERYMAISRASKEETNFMNNIRDFIHDGRIDSAKSLCKNNQSPIARMIAKGIVRIGRPLNDINAAIENVGKLEISKLEKNIAVLATVAGAAPMLGFLGTVIGMIKAFYNMSMAGNNIDISLLAGGIYEAMVTTVTGLAVGVLAYICYNILVARIEKVVFILEARATEFMDLLHEPAS